MQMGMSQSLRNIISVSSALKNTLDYFLEEYFFKPSAIISYSVGPFGGILAGNHLRQILAEMGTPSIPSQLLISKVQQVFDNNVNYWMNTMRKELLDFWMNLIGMFQLLQNKGKLVHLIDFKSNHWCLELL